MLRVYVAGASKELDRARVAMDVIRERGMEVTSTWVEKIREAGRANEGLSPRVAFEAALGCFREVSAADALLILVKPDGASVGAYVEVGIALAQGKPIVVSDVKSDRSVFWAMTDRVFAGDAKAIDYLASLPSPR